MAALKFQFTATGAPLGPVALNACDVFKATVAEPGEIVTLGVGVGVGTEAVVWPSLQPARAIRTPHAQTAFSKFIAAEIGCAGEHCRPDARTAVDSIFRDTEASRP